MGGEAVGLALAAGDAVVDGGGDPAGLTQRIDIVDQREI